MGAALQVMDSRWATQVKQRAVRLQKRVLKRRLIVPVHKRKSKGGSLKENDKGGSKGGSLRKI